jgi:hypothetical protein
VRSLRVPVPERHQLLDRLGVSAGEDLVGSIDARELAARCRRRLWDEARNHDPPREAVSDGRLHVPARRAGYLREKTERLLAIAELATLAGVDVVWS